MRRPRRSRGLVVGRLPRRAHRRGEFVSRHRRAGVRRGPRTCRASSERSPAVRPRIVPPARHARHTITASGALISPRTIGAGAVPRAFVAWKCAKMRALHRLLAVRGVGRRTRRPCRARCVSRRTWGSRRRLTPECVHGPVPEVRRNASGPSSTGGPPGVRTRRRRGALRSRAWHASSGRDRPRPTTLVARPGIHRAVRMGDQGSRMSSQSPTSHCPKRVSPAASTVPSDRTARVWVQPAAMETTSRQPPTSH